MNGNDYILWLPSWYPNKIEPFDGDFVQRHAVATSAFAPIQVLYLIRDVESKFTDSVRVEETDHGNLKETFVYYSVPKMGLKPVERFISLMRYGKLYRRHVRKIFAARGRPSLVHVHIAFKAGLIARWIKMIYGIPYLLTEQWTGYLDEAKPNINQISFTRQYLYSKIISSARLILPVSYYLGNAIQKKWLFADVTVVPNVVNTEIFYPRENSISDKPLRLIHASLLNYQKDPETMLRAISLVREKGIDVRLDVYGPLKPILTALTDELGLQSVVKFHGEVQQPVLAEAMRNAHALVLYSRYETFGCVIIEAFASGIPVIVPDTPLMRELVDNGRTGMLTPGHDPQSLADKIEWFNNSRGIFNKSELRRESSQYDFSTVGKDIFSIYEEIRKASEPQ